LLKINAAIQQESIDSERALMVQSAQLEGVSDGEIAGQGRYPLKAKNFS
jgi:hypothetical protein